MRLTIQAWLKAALACFVRTPLWSRRLPIAVNGSSRHRPDWSNMGRTQAVIAAYALVYCVFQQWIGYYHADGLVAQCQSARLISVMSGVQILPGPPFLAEAVAVFAAWFDRAGCFAEHGPDTGPALAQTSS